MWQSALEPTTERESVEPIGVVLAGGRGRRMGGAKAIVELAGRPLICYPLEALAAALDEVAVLAKADTELPSLPGATIWVEPQPHHHPRRLAAEDPGGAPAVLASSRGAVQPLLGCYRPRALALLGPALDRPLRELVAAIKPRLLEVDDPDVLLNVNEPRELPRAAAALERRRAVRGASRT
jgi:molybdopterin-guanine dinucleotide biosynthesis protein A